MIYLGSLNNILPFDVCKNSEFRPKNSFNRFAPPSWIIFCQIERLFVDASTTNKTHNIFWKSVENWPFGSKNKIL
jgi:hypothetical protein